MNFFKPNSPKDLQGLQTKPPTKEIFSFLSDFKGILSLIIALVTIVTISLKVKDYIAPASKFWELNEKVNTKFQNLKS